MKLIPTNSLEIFKQNTYNPFDIGMVSNNAYISIVATNNCQFNCEYCINSETDKSLNLPIDKAINNINKIVDKYNIKEAIILGGEPTIHPRIFELIKKLRTETNLKFIRLTTNGFKLKNNIDFIEKLVDVEFGVQGLNISFHNEKFMTYHQMNNVYKWIKEFNSNVKVRINSNIWKDNLDDMDKFRVHFMKLENSMDEIRLSNIISKDKFSVNPINKSNDLVLPDDEYNKLFTNIINNFGRQYPIFVNEETLGFVKYVLIPTLKPIIINWNIGSKVSEQICGNNIKDRKINTFKCLVNGKISLSWNESNIIL